MRLPMNVRRMALQQAMHGAEPAPMPSQRIVRRPYPAYADLEPDPGIAPSVEELLTSRRDHIPYDDDGNFDMAPLPDYLDPRSAWAADPSAGSEFQSRVDYNRNEAPLVDGSLDELLTQLGPDDFQRLLEKLGGRGQ